MTTVLIVLVIILSLLIITNMWEYNRLLKENKVIEDLYTSTVVEYINLKLKVKYGDRYKITKNHNDKEQD